MNVLQYFNLLLDTEVEDEQGLWQDIPIDSGCGDSCKAAIIAASLMIYHAKQAHGDHPANKVDQILELTQNICNVYIYG